VERKLASIQRVVELFPIPGADFIEGCRVLGWEFVVKKGEFKAGDLGVFFEIDSLLPEKPEFEFLKSKKYRIKTAKFKSQVSQGLMLPFSCITYADLSSYKEGDDVTDLLGVVKHDPELAQERSGGAKLGGNTKGKFPPFLKKTDEIRIQSIPGFLTRHKGKKFYYTEKCDGSSATFYLKTRVLGDSFLYGFHKRFGYGKLARFVLPYLKMFFNFIRIFFSKSVFGVCSRNLEINEKDSFGDVRNDFWKMARKLDLESKMRRFGMNDICIQGELLGPGIQKNKYKLQEHELRLFNAFNIHTQRYLNYYQTVAIATKLGIEMCPVLGEFELNHTVNELVEMSKGYSKLNPQTLREGIVVRSIEDGDDEEVGRLSFKAINPDFLLKYNE
jgi:RNA ligase (TIGR02306 family)